MTDLADRLSTALGDRYVIQREAGAGGMAIVFVASDVKHDRLVAIKVLRPELAASLGSDRFLREVKITARLTHTNVLPLLDSGDADGLLYYVMPYVAGETLRDRLVRERQLPVGDALQLAREVGDALSYAHDQKVIHRDIKPENILLQSGHAVVADFGIARAVTVAASEVRTATGVAVGTPTYMSPEQATGSKEIDGRSDQYALGCVLYEMLAGQPPFTGPTIESIIRQHVVAPPPSVTSIRPTVSSSVEAALSRALAKSPADRFASVADLVAALNHGDATPDVTRTRRARLATAIGIAAVVIVAGAWLIASGRDGARGPRYAATSLAVLPFENLSANGPHAYFAGALQDELLTQLSRISALKVISRTSVNGYAGRNIPLRQIATELAIGSVVEASVQTDSTRLRVNVRLIDAMTGENIWTQQYDRKLDDAFAIQSDIAQQVVAGVGAAVTSVQRDGMVAGSTSNPEAYRLYLQGQGYAGRSGRTNWQFAQGLYERAVALDPKFARAHAALSQVHGFIYLFRYDPSPARIASQRAEAEEALRLAPDLPQAHFALGLVRYVAPLDYRGALAEFLVALSGKPNDVEYLTWAGFAHRRLGNWNEAIAAYERVRDLDPRAAGLLSNMGAQTFGMMHRYPEAVAVTDRAVALAPDLYVSILFKGWHYASWKGTLDTLRAAVARVPRDASVGPLGSGASQYVRLLHMERRGDSLLHVLARMQTAVFDSPHFYIPSSLYAAWAHEMRGDPRAARAAFDSARVFLDSVGKKLPADWRIHASRGAALAGLGRRGEARDEADWLQRSAVYRDDAFDGPLLGEQRARILATAGDTDAALDEIERLLGRPSYLSANMLRLDPKWDVIRAQPRFKALAAKYTAR